MNSKIKAKRRKETGVFYVNSQGIKKEYTQAEINRLNQLGGKPKEEKIKNIRTIKAPDSTPMFKLNGKIVTLGVLKEWAKEDSWRFIEQEKLGKQLVREIKNLSQEDTEELLKLIKEKKGKK